MDSRAVEASLFCSGKEEEYVTDGIYPRRGVNKAVAYSSDHSRTGAALHEISVGFIVLHDGKPAESLAYRLPVGFVVLL